MAWLFKNEKYVTVEIESIEKTTEKATQIKYCGYNIWLPKSKISTNVKNGKIFINLPE